MKRAAPKTRVLLRRRDGDLCCWCHERMLFLKRGPDNGRTPPNMATIEHIIPKANGGSARMLDNLALAHWRCNSARDGAARPPLPQIEASL